MIRKLISSDQAKPSTKQHKKPCSDCPFRRDSLAGWLGGETSEFFVSFAMGEGVYPCHVKVGPQCSGMAVFRANICKSPRNKEVLELPRDRETVFSWPNEFIEHHNKGVN